MSLLSPAAFAESYADIGARKCAAPAVKTLLLSILAGAFIALGAVTACTAAHGMPNAAAMRIVSGVLFPFGLIMVILTGAELFTGNCLITISVLSGRATLRGMLRNLAVVYLGNFFGALLIALCCAFFGQYDLSDGMLAVYAIKTAAAKCAMPFGNAFVMGVLCNVLVCAAVMLSLCANDMCGRAIGAFVPVCVFVLCGFEHCVANMYYVPAGLFAASVPRYAALAASGGVGTESLTVGNFLFSNLLPVTLGNIVGGAGFAWLIQRCHGKR